MKLANILLATAHSNVRLLYETTDDERFAGAVAIGAASFTAAVLSEEMGFSKEEAVLGYSNWLDIISNSKTFTAAKAKAERNTSANVH